MLRHLVFFEWKFYSRKISFYIMLLLFLALGILVGTSAGISFPNITYNSPYAINFIVGLFSLVSLFPIVIMASQSLLREKDNRFEQLLYTTPITVRNYFVSRFLLVFGVAIITFLLFLLGYIAGHLITIDASEKWGVFHLSYYLHAFLVIVVPNIFLCTVIVSCTAWFSQSKMMIYLSGLGIYVLYMVGSIFSNSPLIAGASPASASAMKLAAKLDPFGMAAFFEQTHQWTALQRNTTLLHLSGNVLFNRVAVLLFGTALLFATYKLFRFKSSNDHKEKTFKLSKTPSNETIYDEVETKTEGNRYFVSTLFSFLKIDLLSTIKSLPFVLLIVITCFVLGMEMYGAIEGGIRLPENYVTTGLMVNTILSTVPILFVFAMLFYGSELVWKSKNANFYSIENSTPFSQKSLFISKCITLITITILLLISCITLGVIFQKIYQYSILDLGVYVSLFYFIGLPASLCGILIIALQYLIKHKYLALSVAGLFLILTNTSLGKAFGFSHPLLRFATFLPDRFSDINGFGYLPKAFLVNMVCSLSFALFLAVVAIIFSKKSLLKIKSKEILILVFPLIVMMISGYYIISKSTIISKTEQTNWAQEYEEKYKVYKTLPQPSITDVKTTIDLYPEENSYKVRGTYRIVNKTKSKISKILVNANTIIKWNSIDSPQLILDKKDIKFGQYLFKLKNNMLPNESITLSFDFEYEIEPLQGHQPFNAIVENGAFMRISNYFPSIGYNADNEIEAKSERKKRNLPLNQLTKVDAPLANPYNYEFINLDATISTSGNQTAVFVGELLNKYAKNNRDYFHYLAKDIPFRFGVSSAKYAMKKSEYNNINIEVLYHPNHYQNIRHLINRIKKSLEYCEKNFGSYPYKTIRFAEISSFTSGFAATAYPATIFINEKQLHLNLLADKQQDIISELAGHELSHQWWGNAQLKPDYREGSGVLTETLAQYTELMLYKNAHGKAKMEEIILLYKELYESEKAFSGEESLYKSNTNNSNVIYNKGILKMYELYLILGEEKINLALKNLLSKHKFPLQPATTLDLIMELKAVSEVSKHHKIERLFME
jgi:ABC-2 type transport system permease protein